MKYIAPSYELVGIETEDVITTSSITPEVSAEGTNPNNGNVIYNALVDINDYLSSLGK